MESSIIVQLNVNIQPNQNALLTVFKLSLLKFRSILPGKCSGLFLWDMEEMRKNLLCVVCIIHRIFSKLTLAIGTRTVKKFTGSNVQSNAFKSSVSTKV